MATDPSFSPTASAVINAGTVSASVALPTAGTPTIAMLTNLGEVPIFAVIGTASTLVATAPLGLPIMPYAEPFAVTIGTNTTIAAVTLARPATLNITVGI